MSSATPHRPSATITTTGRRRRYERSHPYPELPRSRLPFVRAVFWLAVGTLAALARLLWSPVRRALDRRRARRQGIAAVPAPPREVPSIERRLPLGHRAPSLTPL